jgi:hypothetical protein
VKSRRILFFLLAIALGIGAGLAFGWMIMPPKAPVNAPMKDLRVDYKTDLVLMVAESFANHPDSEQALDQLKEIDPGDPLTLIGTSLSYAKEIGYPSADLKLIENLLTNIDLEVYKQWKLRKGDG